MAEPNRNPNPAEVFSANLAFIRHKEENLRILARIQMEEAVRAALPSLSSPPTPDECAELFASMEGDDFAGFCAAVSRICSPAPGDNTSAAPTGPTEENVRIAYLQNAFSDQAYRIFSAGLAGPEQTAAVYFPGFREVAEEVYSGRATHAILPVASSEDGPVLSFRRLIGRYDLKITAAADIPLDEERTMRFALLRRRLPPPPYTASWLELSAVPTDEMSAGALLSACERFGAVLVSAGSHPAGPEEDRNVLDLTFDLRGADPFALYLFLEGSHVRYETVGSYELL